MKQQQVKRSDQQQHESAEQYDEWLESVWADSAHSISDRVRNRAARTIDAIDTEVES